MDLVWMPVRDVASNRIVRRKLFNRQGGCDMETDLFVTDGKKVQIEEVSEL